MKKFFTVCLLVLFACVNGFCDEAQDFVANGDKFVSEKNYGKAAEAYRKALESDPKSAKINLLLGLTYANTGELDKAIEFSLASAQIEPSYQAYHNLGLVYASKKDYEKAKHQYGLSKPGDTYYVRKRLANGEWIVELEERPDGDETGHVKSA